MTRVAQLLLPLLLAGCLSTSAGGPPDGGGISSGDGGVGSMDMVGIPAGSFEMGDHFGLGGTDPRHPSDEVPVHAVQLDAFQIGRTHVTCEQYARFLDSALAQGSVKVVFGTVQDVSSGAALIATTDADPTSRLGFSGSAFQVLAGKEKHPITGVRWEGAAAFCNWLSGEAGLAPCYDLASGCIDYSRKCYRLPTEAEWEYAATGGSYSPYPVYAWGADVDPARANWPDSGDPYETGPEPHTTPVGFYDGSLRLKQDFGWPGPQASYQTRSGANGWGLQDISGNAWQWVNDWYRNDYYQVSPASNPAGPAQAQASRMPDGKPYRGMRGGCWFNGAPDGHSRISNRDPSYYRGPGDPDGPWDVVGFRVVLAHPSP